MARQRERNARGVEPLPPPVISGRSVLEYAGGYDIHTDQIAFAVEITGPWTSSGYPWKRMTLNWGATPPALVNQIGVQQLGSQAFEISGDTTLTAGTRVWLEPSPDGSGYLFRKPGAGGGAVVGLGAANLTETVGAMSWNGRIVYADGTWLNDGTTGADNAWPVECDGAKLAVKPIYTTGGPSPLTVNPTVLKWPSQTAGFWEFFPIQYADLVAGTYYPGLISTGAQAIDGAKTWAKSATFQQAITVATSVSCGSLSSGPISGGNLTINGNVQMSQTVGTTPVQVVMGVTPLGTTTGLGILTNNDAQTLAVLSSGSTFMKTWFPGLPGIVVANSYFAANIVASSKYWIGGDTVSVVPTPGVTGVGNRVNVQGGIVIAISDTGGLSGTFP